MTARTVSLLLAAILSAAVAQAKPPTAKGGSDVADRIAAAARQAWAITDLVLQHDIDPPARQQMLLDGVKALLRSERKQKAPSLSVRVSAVTTPEQFAALLAEVWPANRAGPDDDAEETEELLYRNLFGGGRPHVGEYGYLSAKDRKTYEVIAGNRYVGTGIQIRMNRQTKLPQIVVPFPGGPARKAGARPGDLIVAVNEESMEGRPLRQVVRRLQGEEGSEVSMTVRQPDESKTRRLPMVRSVIPFASVKGYRRTGEESWSFRVDPKSTVGYLSIIDLKSSTLQELRRIEPLVRKEGARALVLDLRFVGGADVRHAALVADGFIDGGVLWRVRDGHNRVKEYKADRDCLFRDMPMAVLIGEQTHGMAAIVAAAMQDRGRAVLVGQPTSGEIVVTSLVPLPEGGGGLLLRTGWVERVARADKDKRSPEAPEESASAGFIVPEHRVNLEAKQSEGVRVWMQRQDSPEAKADAKPPADPQLTKAVSLLSEMLTHSEKKDKK